MCIGSTTARLLHQNHHVFPLNCQVTFSYKSVAIYLGESFRIYKHFFFYQNPLSAIAKSRHVLAVEHYGYESPLLELHLHSPHTSDVFTLKVCLEYPLCISRQIQLRESSAFQGTVVEGSVLTTRKATSLGNCFLTFRINALPLSLWRTSQNNLCIFACRSW